MPIIEIKWILNGVDNIGISEDQRVWRMPYQKGDHKYPLKEIEPHIHTKCQYFRIHKKRFSKRKINDLSIKLDSPKIFTIPEPVDVPFKNI